MANAVFYDPQRRRWRLLRRVFDVVGLSITLLLGYFIFSVVRDAKLPELLLPQQKRPYRALKEKERRHSRPRTAAHRTSKTPPTQVPLNSDEGIRAAFYVNWDPGSFASLREYVNQIDLLFPEWLHVLSPDGRLQASNQENRLLDVIQNGAVRTIDNKVMPLMKAEHAETEVLPLVNNFDPVRSEWISGIGEFLNNADARARFRQESSAFLASDNYRGLTLDFESFPASAQPGFRALVSELFDDLHGRGMKLYVSVPALDTDFDYGYLAAHSDGLILMNYDQHFAAGNPGPVAGQEWFTDNLVTALKTIPRDKIICAVGNYGYDWIALQKGKPRSPNDAKSISVQEAWLAAHDSESEINFDSDLLNPHYAYLDEHNIRHDVWYLDAVTALNQMRAARRLGINTFALWRLGSEDRSLWGVWDTPGEKNAAEKLRNVPPGQDVDTEGEGEIIRISGRPVFGERIFTENSETALITAEKLISFPAPYELSQYGARPKQVALTFDDGPDPQWTPQVLDALTRENAKAAFFVIGMQAEKYPGLTRRIFREGHEIGNHTFMHPDISNISRRYMKVELNLAERLFAAFLGVKPLLFRPPYSIDQEPDTADQVRPLEIAQGMGYITVGDKIDPNDWQDNPRPSAEQITARVLQQLPPCGENPRCGNIVLLHDGGGNRAETVRAIPMMIRALRARGFEVVPVSTLLGKSYADVMPPISAGERWSALANLLGFWLFGLVGAAIVVVFFVGDILMSARLVFVGALAVFDRFRKRALPPRAMDYRPSVAVLIPAYNEEKVIVRTVRAAVDSDYPNLRVIVIDDGSGDRTLEVARAAFAQEEADGRVLILTKPNSGKAAALNYGLTFVDEELYVGIDADTVIAPDAISYLVQDFADPQVAAVAGNAKVGNRVNLWTRWQALEYVTSQNFERRALNVFGAVTVVPGAVGAWRTSAVREAGGYHRDTVAEDADLTMALLRRGYRVQYEDRALAYTEAPSTARGLMRQRFRWSFGILQSVWKHRQTVARKGALGWISLPNIIIFQILLPMVSPFIDVMFVLGAVNFAFQRYFHPDTADVRGFEKLVLYFAAFIIIDFIASAIAFALERRDADRQEQLSLLPHVWLQRFAYRQLFAVVLFKTLKRAMEGGHFSWDKLERTAALEYAGVRPRATEEVAQPRG